MKTKTFRFVAIILAFSTLAIAIVVAFRPSSVDQSAFSTTAIAENASNGKPTAVLYFARWTVSADPKGTLATPGIAQSLTDSRFAYLTADLTDFPRDALRQLKGQGYDTLPVLILYPTGGPPIGFTPDATESEIVDAIHRIARDDG